jgi:hypothetical protein
MDFQKLLEEVQSKISAALDSIEEFKTLDSAQENTLNSIHIGLDMLFTEIQDAL